MTQKFIVKVVNTLTSEIVKFHEFATEGQALKTYNYYVFKLDHKNFDLVMEG